MSEERLEGVAAQWAGPSVEQLDQAFVQRDRRHWKRHYELLPANYGTQNDVYRTRIRQEYYMTNLVTISGQHTT